MIKNEEILEKSMKLSNNVGFLLNGENIVVGIFAILCCLKKIVDQQDVISVDDICGFIKDSCEVKEKNND